MAFTTQRPYILQIVFLIDENSACLEDETQLNKSSNSVRLCVLQILTYLHQQQSEHSRKFKWGFKFYNSRSLKQRYERHNFNDFCVSSFEEFENDVCYRFEEVFRKKDKVTHYEKDDYEAEEKASTVKTTAAKCLACALTDLVHDFQWENTDILSPIKGSRNVDVHTKSTRNVVFIISSCPSSKEDLVEFCGNEIRRCEDFVSCVMSSALLREFSNVYKIALNWIDSRLGVVASEIEPRNIIIDFLKLLHGRLIPLSALVGQNWATSEPAGSACGADSKACSMPLPITSVMDQFLHPPPTCGISKVDGPSYDMLGACDNDLRGLWTGLLCSSGTVKKAHCVVKLSPMLPSMLQLSPSASYQSASPNLVWVKGVLRREKICPTWLHEAKVYTCVGMVTDHKDGHCSKTRMLSGYFRNLLLDLARRNLLLIVELCDPDSGLPVTAALQPLTSSCGVLSVVSSQMMLALEKLLLWTGESHEIFEEEIPDTLGKLLFPQSSKGERSNEGIVLAQRVIRCPVMQSTSSTTEARQFDSGDLDSWKLGLACSEGGPPSLDEIHRESNTSIDSPRQESSLIKKLKELYSTTSIQPRNSGSGRGNYVESATKEDQEEKTDTAKTIQREAKSKEQQQAGNEKSEKNEESHMEKLIKSLENGDQHAVAYLKELYQRALAESIDLTGYIKQTMAVVKWRIEQAPNMASIQSLLSEHLLQDNTSIRSSYEGSDVMDKGRKVKEYQVQILLRMELALLVEEPESNCGLVNEVVVMLRAISFAKDPGFLREFMHEIILQRYSNDLQKFLCEVYEGLMQKPPQILLSPSQLSDDESPLKRCMPSISKPESNQPSSNSSSLGCPLTRRRSIAELGGKRREIVIPGRAKPKASKIKKKDHGAHSARDSRPTKVKSQTTPVKQVRRNLFTGEEDLGEGRKRNTKKDKHSRDKSKFSRRHSVAACASSVVQETPARKQLPNALWQRQHRARKRTSTATELDIVKESPLKDVISAENLPRRSPRRHPFFQRSTSFYGSTAASCPLKRTRSFTVSNSCTDSPMKRLKLDPDTESPAKTPTKTVTDTPVKESPVKFSPTGKRKKFSLHALLSQPLVPSPPRRKIQRSPGRVTSLRSSPRLLQRRSFSCIGFVNSAPLVPRDALKGTDARGEQVSDDGTQICSLQRSSSDGFVSSGSRLRRALLQSPSRPTPRKSRNSTYVTSTDVESSQSIMVENRSTTFTEESMVFRSKLQKEPLQSPRRQSPRLKRNSAIETYESSPASSSALLDQSMAHEASLRRTLLQSPRRQSPRLKRNSPCDDGTTGRYLTQDMSTVGNRSPREPCTRNSRRHFLQPQEKQQELIDSDLDIYFCVDLEIEKESEKQPPSVSRSRSSGSFEKTRKYSGRSKTISNEFVPEHSPGKKVQSCGEPVISPCPEQDASSESEKDLTNKSLDSALEGLKSDEITPDRKARTRSADRSRRLKRPKSKEFPTPDVKELRLTLGLKSKGVKVEEFGFQHIADVRSTFADVTENSQTITRERGGDDNCKSSSLQRTEDFSPAQFSRKSPRKLTSSKGSQLLLRPSHSTPPSKKTKRGVSGSPRDSKRSSPINQLLKQRKRNKPNLKTAQVETVFGSNPLKKSSPKKKTHRSRKGKTNRGISLPPPYLTDECSQDMIDDWLSELDKQENATFEPPTNFDDFAKSSAELPNVVSTSDKSPSCDLTNRVKAVVFGSTSGKNTESRRSTPNTSFDSSFDDEDDVFQSPSDILRSRKKRPKMATRISENSLKLLQESPILANKKSVFRPSPSSHTKNWADFSPSDNITKKARLSRRKRSQAFSSESDHDTSISECTEGQTHSEERLGRTRKRLKLQN
ncbi:treslin [Nematostella vectensis]|uniref:treslin n=1 Tax=Nematostella vectensis TaxID=45351 RepID=UPI0020775540|nr:treslin [Nematostella vectensis]